MNLGNFPDLWIGYVKQWDWLSDKSPLNFGNERYESLSGREKQRAFWDSQYWKWLKRNKEIEFRCKCQHCENSSYALHHSNKSSYYLPQPSDLELLCSDCHDKDHLRGKYSPDSHFQNKDQNMTTTTTVYPSKMDAIRDNASCSEYRQILAKARQSSTMHPYAIADKEYAGIIQDRVDASGKTIFKQGSAKNNKINAKSIRAWRATVGTLENELKAKIQSKSKKKQISLPGFKMGEDSTTTINRSGLDAIVRAEVAKQVGDQRAKLVEKEVAKQVAGLGDEISKQVSKEISKFL